MASYFDFKAPKDKAFFWSKNKLLAKKLAKQIDGLTLEMTPGGKVFDRWPWLKKKFPDWGSGGPLDRSLIWQALSERYAWGVSGKVTYVNPFWKKGRLGWMWKEVELKILKELINAGIVDNIIYLP